MFICQSNGRILSINTSQTQSDPPKMSVSVSAVFWMRAKTSDHLYGENARQFPVGKNDTRTQENRARKYSYILLFTESVETKIFVIQCIQYTLLHKTRTVQVSIQSTNIFSSYSLYHPRLHQSSQLLAGSTVTAAAADTDPTLPPLASVAKTPSILVSSSSMS